jgi:patatin-like phospholipase/acyl hydrolase
MKVQHQNISGDNGYQADQGYVSDQSTGSNNVYESQNDKHSNQSKKVRILSLDGGGIRGIIPATILLKMEQMIQEKTGREDARLCDYFDLIAGTSTGGILTCAYLTPSPEPEKNGRPMTAGEALDVYLKQGKNIFHLPTSRKIKTLFGAVEEKYSASSLEAHLRKKFGKRRLSELLKPCLITSYDIEKRRAFFFDQLNAKKQKSRDFDVWEVARATSAAPIGPHTRSLCVPSMGIFSLSKDR